MSNRSRDKGSAFEREVAKAFSAAFSAPFVRSSGSGAWLGGKNARRAAPGAARRDRLGDITCPDGLPFIVEAKRYKEIPDMFVPSAKLNGWLDQLLQGVRGDDVPILVFKADRKPALAAVPGELGVHVAPHVHYMRYYHARNWAILLFEDALAGLARQYKGAVNEDSQAEEG